MPNIVLKVLFFCLSYFILDKEEMKKFFLMCLLFVVSMNISMNSLEFKARVIDIKDHSIIVSHKGQRIKVQTSYSGSLDDQIYIVGESTDNIPNNHDNSQRVLNVIKSKNVQLIKKGTSIRSYLFNKNKEHPFLRSVLFNQFLETIPVLSSLSLQLSGLLLLSDLFTNKYLGKSKQIYIKRGICLFYMLIFGINFSSIRIGLKQFIKQDKQIPILLILFPTMGQNFAFLYPFSHTLLSKVHENLKKIHSYTLFPILTLISQYRFNLLEFLLFPLMRYLMGIVFILALFIPQSSQFLEVFLSKFFLIINSIDRLIILGKPSLLFLSVIIILLLNNKQKSAYYTFILMIILMIYPPSHRITFIDVGQGDATLIQYPFNAYTILIDTGKGSAKYQLEKSLKKHGVNRIDTLIITHDDEDHYGNLESLKPIARNIIETKKQIILGLSEFLKEKEYHSDDNANSLIFYLKVKETSFLFLGDAGKEQELDILQEHQNLKIDVLKLGHHGSKTSTDDFFVRSIEPKYAIASSKPKVYGHPHKEVKRVLHNNRVKLLETSDEGDIQFIFTFLFDFIRTDAGGFGIMK